MLEVWEEEELLKVADTPYRIVGRSQGQRSEWEQQEKNSIVWPFETSAYNKINEVNTGFEAEKRRIKTYRPNTKTAALEKEESCWNIDLSIWITKQMKNN